MVSPVPQAYGALLNQGEYVVFAHEPPPIGAGERAALVFLGVMTLLAIFGIFIIIYALTKKADRAWFITNQRVVNVSAKGEVKSVRLDKIALASRNKSAGAVELRYGMTTVCIPLRGTINGVHALDFAKNPQVAADMPAIGAPLP